MKKLMFLLTLLILIVPVLAQPPMPKILNGLVSINNEFVEGITVTMEVKETGETFNIETSRSGFYVFELDKLGDWNRWYYREYTLLLNIDIPGLEDYTIDYILQSSNHERFDLNFILGDYNPPEPKPGEEIIIIRDKYKCWDFSVVTSLANCPAYEVCPSGKLVYAGRKEAECPKITCPSGDIVFEGEQCLFVCEGGERVETEDDCPDNSISFIYKGLIALAIIILGAFGWGKGFAGLAKYYWNKGAELIAEGKKTKNTQLTKQGKAYQARAIKMVGTAIKNFKDGKYK